MFGLGGSGACFYVLSLLVSRDFGSLEWDGVES